MQAVRLPAALVSRHALPNDVGLMVVSAEPGGPGDRAGVMIGDVLVAVGGKPVVDPSELLGLLGGERIGTNLAVRLVRAGEPTDVTITIGERPAEPRGARRGR
jgi:S1-C subfamily serine protease